MTWFAWRPLDRTRTRVRHLLDGLSAAVKSGGKTG